MKTYLSILDDVKHLYGSILDPSIIDVSIINHNMNIYLEIIKSRHENDHVIYRYALKDWGIGSTYTAEELGISPNEDFSVEEAENQHLSMPFFSPENDIQVSVDRFVALFMMEKETLMNLTELFDVDKID